MEFTHKGFRSELGTLLQEILQFTATGFLMKEVIRNLTCHSDYSCNTNKQNLLEKIHFFKKGTFEGYYKYFERTIYFVFKEKNSDIGGVT